MSQLLKETCFAHSEHILLSMICYDIDYIKELGWRKILKTRNSNQKENIRKFDIPPVNFDAKSCYSIINWHDEEMTMAALTSMKDVTIEDFEDGIEKKLLQRIIDGYALPHSNSCKTPQIGVGGVCHVLGAMQREAFMINRH